MKILRLVTPGADPALAEQLRDAIQAFNRGLDIRLRFLSIFLEDEELRLEDAESAAERTAEALDAARPSVVIVHGDGPAALAAATIAARGDAVLAHLGAGERGGDDADTARAVDRLCGLLLPVGETALGALDSEGLAERTRGLVAGPDLGHQVIKALRAERVRRRGETTC